MNQKTKHSKWWIVLVVILVFAIVFVGAGKMKAGRTDADLVLTISEQGFEGHLYDAGEKIRVS